MNKSTKNPIIIIPGMMGSIGGDMLPKLGQWRFGVAKWIYDPLVKGLQDIGYRLNDNLFICFYDWRMKTSESSKLYLEPMIEMVKTKYPNRKISLICHSMGGLVARNYLQGGIPRGLIERFIMIGSPNKGSIDSYYFWSTGTQMKKDKKTYYNMTYKGYIWLISKLLKIPLGTKNLNELHQCFKGMEDLLPAQEYGYVLCYKDNNNELQMLPRSFMKYPNTMLDNLNMELGKLASNVDAVYCIVGTGSETLSLLMLDENKLFNEGIEEIIGSISTIEGDGTVTQKSASIAGFSVVEIKGTHHSIVKDSINFIYELYGVEANEIMEVKENSIHLIFTPNIDIYIKQDDQIILSFINGSIQTKYEFLYEDFQQEFLWIAIKNIPAGSYQLEVNNIAKQDIHMLLMSEGVDEEITEFEHQVEKSKYYKISFEVI